MPCDRAADGGRHPRDAQSKQTTSLPRSSRCRSLAADRTQAATADRAGPRQNLRARTVDTKRGENLLNEPFMRRGPFAASHQLSPNIRGRPLAGQRACPISANQGGRCSGNRTEDAPACQNLRHGQLPSCKLGEEKRSTHRRDPRPSQALHPKEAPRENPAEHDAKSVKRCRRHQESSDERPFRD